MVIPSFKQMEAVYRNDQIFRYRHRTLTLLPEPNRNYIQSIDNFMEGDFFLCFWIKWAWPTKQLAASSRWRRLWFNYKSTYYSPSIYICHNPYVHPAVEVKADWGGVCTIALRSIQNRDGTFSSFRDWIIVFKPLLCTFEKKRIQTICANITIQTTSSR